MIEEKQRRLTVNLILLPVLLALLILTFLFSISAGYEAFTPSQIMEALFRTDNSMGRKIIYNIRLPRALTACFIGICLSLSGCILQGVMRNKMASPSTIGVTSGASFMGYLTMVAFPAYASLLPLGAFLGAFGTTMLIYLLAYEKGVSPVKIILSGMAVSAVFGAFNDIIRSFFSENLSGVQSYLVGGLSGVTWKNVYVIMPFALVGMAVCLLFPHKMNILMLGDEVAGTLGLRVERFRLLLIVTSSMLAGASVAVAGMISFVGLIVPHISRLMVGSDHKFLFPASILTGATLVLLCDTVGRLIILPGEIPVSIILAFIGAPFFLWLMRTREKEGG